MLLFIYCLWILLWTLYHLALTSLHQSALTFAPFGANFCSFWRKFLLLSVQSPARILSIVIFPKNVYFGRGNRFKKGGSRNPFRFRLFRARFDSFRANFHLGYRSNCSLSDQTKNFKQFGVFWHQKVANFQFLSILTIDIKIRTRNWKFCCQYGFQSAHI